MRTVFALFAFLLLLATSCVSRTEYSEFKELPKNGWPQGLVYDFGPVTDTICKTDSIPMDVHIVVRHSRRCNIQSLLLKIEEMGLDYDKPTETWVTIPLFEHIRNNKESRKTSWGVYDPIEISTLLRNSIIVPQGYTISLSTPYSPEETQGMISVGITVSQHGPNTLF